MRITVDVSNVLRGSAVLTLLFLIPISGNSSGIEIYNPMSDNVWFTHDVRTIQWQVDEPLAKIRIELHKADDFVSTISFDCVNTEAYSWTVPEGLVSGGDYRIKIVDITNDANHCYSQYFRIVGDILPGANAASSPYEGSRQWQIDTIDAGNVGYYSSIDVDSQNRPHISYYDASNDDLKYAYWDGSAWQIQVIDQSGDVGRWTSIAVDRNTGDVHISYCHESNRDLVYAHWDGATWDIDTVDGQGSNRGEFTSIALDSYGNPHISYVNGDVGDILWAYKIGGPPWWGTHLVDDDHDTGRYTSIVFDSSDYPHFSYHDYTWSLFTNRRWCKYACYNGSTFPSMWVDTRYYTGYYTSIAVDNYNLPHISYQGASNCDYARWNGSVWQLVAVDPDGGSTSGWLGTSILLDDDYNPHIAYYRRTSGSLGYAYWNGVSWVLEIIDDVGDVGGYCSMVLDDDGYLHISYADMSNGFLKYATREMTGVEEEPPHHATGSMLQIVPNPAKTFFTISARKAVRRVEVYDVLGNIVQTAVTPGDASTITVSAEDLSAGIYFMKVTVDEADFVEKVVVTK
jgi:hypothetical protein